MRLKYFTITALTASLALICSAQAKPLTYPGGWQTTAEVTGDMVSLLNTYTITPKWGVGLHNEYDREMDYQMHSLHVTHLLWRGNYPDAQANLFLQGGAGYARSDEGADSVAGYAGLLADWENRRFYTEYSNRYVHAGGIDKKFTQQARIGVAPYVAEAGSLHTWLILQADHTPTNDDTFSITPVVRVFKKSTMVEAGVRDDGQVMLHLMHAF